MTASRMMGAVPLLMGAMPAHAATGSGGVSLEAGPIALLGVVAAIAWHFVANRWQKSHGRHVFIRVMPATVLVPVLARLNLDRDHLRLLRRRARRLYRRG
ncbi:MAG TPA: hypothetical protein VFK85_10785 [Anaeromyxobacteraceae bacterium]|nr:hypothetical protein [Anaeromyxobacteraceae bacterium]